MPAPALESVLVIGGCGFLGHHIVQRLADSDDTSKITVFDVRTSQNRVAGPEYVSGSITSREDVLAILNKAKPKVVFHTASPKALTSDMKLFESVNVHGTRILLDCAQECGFTKAFIYTSSSSVVHDNYSHIINATEEAPLLFMPAQKEFYSHTKAIAEAMVRATNKRGGMLTTVIRPAGLFGEGDIVTIGGIVKNAKEGKSRLQIGDNTNLFDWTYVGNHADAQLLAARILVRDPPPPDNMRVDGEAFVVTNDEPWPFWDFTRGVAAAAGYPVRKDQVRTVPLGIVWVYALVAEWLCWIFTMGTKEPALTRGKIKYTTMTRTFNIDKAKSRLGYRAQISMQDGITRAGKWYVDQSNKGVKQT